MTDEDVRPAVRDLSTRAVDCLKYLYKLRERGERVTTSGVRERLQALEPRGHLSDASVTQLFKALAEQGYIEHRLYHGAELTAKGEAAAAELVRHHRLLELYLVEHLGFGWDEVDAEAERLEHAISEEFEERVDRLLGRPTADPHGDPIPSKSGKVIAPDTLPLVALADGREAVVRRVHDDSAEKLRYLAKLGLVPGARVCLLERAPFGNLLTVEVSKDDRRATHAIGADLAAEVQVEAL